MLAQFDHNYGIYSDFKINVFFLNCDFPNTRGTLRVIFGKIQLLTFYKSAQNMLISSFPCRKVHRHETEISKFCVLTLKGRSPGYPGL